MKTITLNKKTVQEILNKELVMRTATNNYKIETSYCTSCKFNHYSNIGHENCVKCGNKK